MSQKGVFIVLEGIDGSGKTTLAKALKERMEAKGFRTELTAEPTSGTIGSLLRSEKIGDPKAETLLFIADRSCHTAEISSMLDEGISVISDRYYASTLAYQSAALEGPSFDYDLLEEMNRAVVREPDITILLDLDPEESAGRVSGRGERLSKFERLEFQRRVRDNYLKIAEKHGFTILDASCPKEELCNKAMERIDDLLR